MGYTLKEIVQDWRDIQSRNDIDDERILKLVEKMKQIGIAFPDELGNMSTDELRAYLEKKYYFAGPSSGTGGSDTNGEQNKPVNFALIPKAIGSDINGEQNTPVGVGLAVTVAAGGPIFWVLALHLKLKSYLLKWRTK